MWIISRQMFKKLFTMISGSLSNIEKQLEFDRQVKVHTARRLMDFQKRINRFNSQYHYQYRNFVNKQDISENAVLNIKFIEIHLIMYMSVWSINVKQNVISKETVKRCLGSLLYEESQLLGLSLIYLIRRKRTNYIDAVNCEWLLYHCAKLNSEEKESFKNVLKERIRTC